MTKTISSKLPAATLAQRLASMSETELMVAARKLATSADLGADAACTAVLEELESRAAGPAFDAFVAEIYA